MTGTPEGVKHLLFVKDQGPHGRSLGIPREPPPELPEAADDLGWFLTPTTRVVVWIFRRPNRVWALPITLLLVPGYLVAAGLVQSYLVPADGIYLLVAWLCVYNAAKFALTGTIAFLMNLTTCLTRLAKRPRRPRPSAAQVQGPLPTIW
ncbi:hypothetical protein ACFT2C_04540 [Promicromonospora sp. NPDC057138]|uniref:hypothetical protein n=1 Tax=Promicromonospora sp. NPDC057138 TaxID=3346031 RepID=UPI0036262183